MSCARVGWVCVLTLFDTDSGVGQERKWQASTCKPWMNIWLCISNTKTPISDKYLFTCWFCEVNGYWRAYCFYGTPKLSERCFIFPTFVVNTVSEFLKQWWIVMKAEIDTLKQLNNWRSQKFRFKYIYIC